MRYEFIVQYQYKERFGDNLSVIETSDQRETISATIETAVLSAICSTRAGTCKMELSVLHAMVKEAIAIENFDRITESHWSILPNLTRTVPIASSEASPGGLGACPQEKPPVGRHNQWSRSRSSVLVRRIRSVLARTE
ncbi:hypothetical protein TRICI_005977 [Trichomonascus ciferrii]|uniref:Uncharacterized protein n=1 Tax=Trichomonascus ciferrii TaxID=44093 RepID=A0A642UMU8_9ASCO|nr:hypothetical protein TRICI_005977 [Trichomonascus ciferrii]